MKRWRTWLGVVLLLAVATAPVATAKAVPAAGAAGSGSPLLAAVDVGLDVDPVLDVGAPVDVGAGVELALEAPRSWTYLADLERLAQDANWPLEIGVQGLVGGCLEPRAGPKTRVRGYQLSRGVNKAVKIPQSVDVSTLCVLPSWGDQLTGLFVTADPMGYVDGPSMYAFARFDPVNRSDPMGLNSGRSDSSGPKECGPGTGKSRDICLQRQANGGVGGFDPVEAIDQKIEEFGDYCVDKGFVTVGGVLYFIEGEFPDDSTDAAIDAALGACVAKVGGMVVKRAGPRLARWLSKYGDETVETTTGGRTVQQLLREFEEAEAAYDAIRKTDDVSDIARHTGLPETRIQRIKDHLFENEHMLDEGMARFDADPEIAGAWKRLQSGTHTDADIQLIEHELFESKFEGIFRTDYRTAHDAANRSGRPSGLEGK